MSSPLHLAVRGGNIETIRLCLATGAKVDQQQVLVHSMLTLDMHSALSIKYIIWLSKHQCSIILHKHVGDVNYSVIINLQYGLEFVRFTLLA